MRVVLVAAILCVAVMVSTAHVGPAPVTIVDVEAPAINCIFDLDCTIVVTDTTDHFTPAPLPRTQYAFKNSFQFSVLSLTDNGLTEN